MLPSFFPLSLCCLILRSGTHSCSWFLQSMAVFSWLSSARWGVYSMRWACLLSCVLDHQCESREVKALPCQRRPAFQSWGCSTAWGFPGKWIGQLWACSSVVGPLQLELSRSSFYDFLINHHSTHLVAIDSHANKMRWLIQKGKIAHFYFCGRNRNEGRENATVIVVTGYAL